MKNQISILKRYILNFDNDYPSISLKITFGCFLYNLLQPVRLITVAICKLVAVLSQGIQPYQNVSEVHTTHMNTQTKILGKRCKK